MVWQLSSFAHTNRQAGSDLKGSEPGLCLLLVTQISDAVSEISKRGGGPLVDVLFCRRKVVPQRHAAPQPLCVGLNFLRGLMKHSGEELRSGGRCGISLLCVEVVSVSEQQAMVEYVLVERWTENET